MNALYHNHPKNVLVAVSEFSEGLALYPPNVLNYKDKRAKPIENASTEYGTGLDVLGFMKQIDCTYLIGLNDHIVDVFVEYTARLLASIEYFLESADTASKGCSEVSQFYKELRLKFKKKILISAMLDDLAFWSDNLSFEISKKDLLNDFEEERGSYLQSLQSDK